MANSVQQNKRVSEMAAAALASDLVLQHQLKTLVRDVIGHMQFVMGPTGLASDKVALVKAITPQLLSALQSTEQEEKKRKEKASIERIYAMLRGELSVEDLAAELAS